MKKVNPQSTTSVNSIVIAGGGTAGWLTAAIIAAENDVINNPNLEVTLVESPEVHILGVGEGTWPTMRDTLRRIGVDEREFLLECNVSFKQGTCFNNWRNNEPDDTYYHPFDLPVGFFEADVTAWWQQRASQIPFASLFSTQVDLCRQSKAPKQLKTPPFAAVANYGYHLDASKFADFLKRHCIEKLGIIHVLEHIEQVETDQNNFIRGLRGKQQYISGQLFIDCTGFAAKLIGEHYKSDLHRVDDILKNNTALAAQASYLRSDAPIASTTLSTAQPHGWIWDIGLPTRKGVGYVHSAEHCDINQAADTLLRYLNNDKTTESVSSDQLREIRFTPGYRKQSWVKNCVAIGTSAGFLEPLEASALVMIELAARHVANQLPATMSTIEAASRHYNHTFEAKWQRIIDFLKLHYVLSKREDSDYWRDMRDMSTASSQLYDWLMQWQQRPVSQYDFMYSDEIFPMASYQYILCGMGFASGAVPHLASHENEKIAHFLKTNERRKKQQNDGLLSNRAYIDALKISASQTVR
ncbi:tryptophan halogenase family protein [Salinimonas chungwhensis]|uniref:tryptophan halogenase family protein n=1 Tax=Salinimonas chungwhensis TaxID=265425 RepID=UPI0003709DCE|nr:tryptophan halogenase family protein [Salinimonas chungwhensis]